MIKEVATVRSMDVVFNARPTLSDPTELRLRVVVSARTGWWLNCQDRLGSNYPTPRECCKM
ncbi:MAG: hypothetical protein U1G05_14980 [Kiritimatiellia bacterium]